MAQCSEKINSVRSAEVEVEPVAPEGLISVYLFEVFFRVQCKIEELNKQGYREINVRR